MDQKTELIKKHLEDWNGLQKSSIDHFAETGKVSGSLFLALKAMMDEYAKPYHYLNSKNINEVELFKKKIIIRHVEQGQKEEFGYIKDDDLEDDESFNKLVKYMSLAMDEYTESLLKIAFEAGQLNIIGGTGQGSIEKYDFTDWLKSISNADINNTLSEGAYCCCTQRSLMKSISETEYECFDCGKEIKNK